MVHSHAFVNYLQLEYYCLNHMHAIACNYCWGVHSLWLWLWKVPLFEAYHEHDDMLARLHPLLLVKKTWYHEYTWYHSSIWITFMMRTCMQPEIACMFPLHWNEWMRRVNHILDVCINTMFHDWRITAQRHYYCWHYCY